MQTETPTAIAPQQQTQCPAASQQVFTQQE